MMDFEKCKSKIENFDAGEIKDKIADIVAGAKVGDLFRKNEKPVVIEAKKEKSPLVIILAIIGCIAAVAAISYAVYRFCIKSLTILRILMTTILMILTTLMMRMKMRQRTQRLFPSKLQVL